ncbi:MAG TPA: helix-turn-helix transcriptional regulator [Ktedonobacterales bacterium]
MDSRALLLLGLLRTHSQHGYQLNDYVERNLGRVTDMKKPTAYAILDRLAREGYVSVEVERMGNRPQRKVYAITPSGEALFLTLLRENLATSAPLYDSGDIGTMFAETLPASEVRELLRTRHAQLRDRLAEFERAPAHAFGLGVNLAIEHSIRLMRAEDAWLTEVVERLARET